MSITEHRYMTTQTGKYILSRSC